jgi:hypothetical protein
VRDMAVGDGVGGAGCTRRLDGGAGTVRLAHCDLR